MFHNLRLSAKPVQNTVSSVEAIALWRDFFSVSFIVFIQLAPYSQQITTILDNSKRVPKYGHTNTSGQLPFGFKIFKQQRCS